MENYDAGTLLVTDRGQLVMLTADGVQTGELLPNGTVPQFYEGVALPSIARWRGAIVRRAGHISDLVRILSQTVDIKTAAVKSDSDLTDRELLEKIRQENAELKKQQAIAK